jgi:hypothetical protein
MHRIQSSKFSHRLNGSMIHSYCSRCYANVAISSSESHLQTQEKKHKCDPKLLELVKQYRESTTFLKCAELRYLLESISHWHVIQS